MSDDTVPLVERLAEAACRAEDCIECEGTGRSLQGWSANYGDQFGPCQWGLKIARALLPVVEQAVTEARGEALREAADLGPLHFAATHTHRDARGWNVVEAEWLRARADEVTP